MMHAGEYKYESELEHTCESIHKALVDADGPLTKKELSMLAFSGTTQCLTALETLIDADRVVKRRDESDRRIVVYDLRARAEVRR